MKCQNLFSEKKNKKNILIFCLLKILPRMLMYNKAKDGIAV